jgi:transcription factor E
VVTHNRKIYILFTFIVMMQLKLLENIIMKVAGKPACDILNLIYGKRDVNEFLIAKKLDLTINQVRNILYKLSNYHLVFFIRKKDKRKGWYTYYWTFDTKKCLEFMKKELEKEKQFLENNLKNRTQRRFYSCLGCSVEVNEDKALQNNFICQECGEVYTLSDNKQVIEEITPEIARKDRQIKVLDEELVKVNHEETKKRVRKDKRKKKAQKKERDKKRKANKEEKDKLKKKEETKKKKNKQKSVSKKKPKKVQPKKKGKSKINKKIKKIKPKHSKNTKALKKPLRKKKR